MNRWTQLLLIAVMTFPAVIFAQTGNSPYEGPIYRSHPYSPAVPAPSMTTSYGGYPYYGGGTTAAGSALNGLGNAMSAAGSMHLSNSAAAVNMTQAQRNEIQNRQLGASTYFQMRHENEAWQKSQQQPAPTEEELARMARDAAPRPLSAGQVEPGTGKINWPGVLQQDNYAPQRNILDNLSAKMTTYGHLSFADQMKARHTIEEMFAMLKAQIRDVPPEDYVSSRVFLRSLIYALSKTDLS